MQEFLANNTTEGQREIRASFKRTAKHTNNQYRSVPVHKLPAETAIQIDCGSKQYTLLKHQYHMCTLINHQNAAVADVRIITEVLAPTSTVRANVMSEDTSKQPDTMESPVISRICIPMLHGEDIVLDDATLPVNRPLIARAL